jgi:mannose-6-phosphate isomerase
MEEKFFYTEERPWGKFTTLLVREGCKVKEIEVNPGERLSYQSHSKRKEKWVVFEGIATVTLNERVYVLHPGDSIEIPVEAKHRVQNNEKKQVLKFVEVQTGTYFGEDDIIRYEDDYGRTKQKKREV